MRCPLPGVRRFCVATLVAALTLASACSGEDPAATGKASPKPKTASSAKPKASASPVAASPTPSATPSASPSPGEAPSPSPTPSASASPKASATPAVAVSAPPIPFPYTREGLAFPYDLKVHTTLADVGGDFAMTVSKVSADDATLDATFTLTKAPPGAPGAGKPTTRTSTVKNSVANPYALGVLFPKDGVSVTDTITAVAAEQITVAAGTFDAKKYTIKEVTGTDSADVLLWTDASDGTMLKQQITGTKPPSLVDLGAAAAFITGQVVTTLELKTKPAADGGASQAACPTQTDPTATGAAGQGDFAGKTLPSGWDTAYPVEAAVTDEISLLADAAKNKGGADATQWTNFKCFYPAAVAVWRTKTSRTD